MNHSVIAGIIAFVLRDLAAVLFVIALLSAGFDRRRPNRFLAWLLLLPIGVGGLWSGFFHTVYPELAARFIGWQDSPFQFEVGMADLAFGITGCIAFWAGQGFRAATVLVNAIFLLGDAGGHVHQMTAASNFSPGNAGPVFYLDIILPLVTIVLLATSAGDRDGLHATAFTRRRSF
jgi:hypothetical protein